MWYIRHNTISGDVTLVKAMIKFAAFLVLGNIINIVGQVTPLLFAVHHAATPHSSREREYRKKQKECINQFIINLFIY